jgi:HK97 family phage major capsid protein/HK97 family phage prohead protease
MTVVRKVTVAKAAGDDLEFVLSDDTKDRYGDVIDPKGWVLDNFKKNPIALFNHNSNFPIGRWENVRVQGGKLIGKLKLAAKGTSDRIDELLSLVEQGILRAVSVGFQPIEREALKDNSGILFKRQELLETSLVSVPANPSAVQLARSLHVSDETIALAFGEHAGRDGGTVRRSSGEQAATSPARKSSPMNIPLSKRIEDAQARLVALRDQLTDHLTNIGDEPDDAAMAITDELNGKVALQQRALDGLREAETRLAAQSDPVSGSVTRSGDGRRPFAVPTKKIEPKEYALRAGVIKLLSHIERKPIDLVRSERYGDDEATKVVSDFMLTKAATAPATTTTSGWASQLVETVNADFMESLMPASVYPGLSARGLRLNFGRAGTISIPSRAATPTIAGSFVGEGSPIPVRQGAFASTTLTPKKLAVISTFTREIAEHSTPAIEGLIRNAIQEDTSVAVDSVLLDATAASAIRPAGLRNGVTVTTATAGGGFAALVGDIKALVGALITATNGNVRAPVWIMNPIQAIAIALTQNAGGDFPFQQEINGNRLQGFPVIQSASVTAGMLILVDAADFVSVTGDDPRWDVSDQATLHMEDTTPLAIGTAGAPNTVAAPVRSLFQTDTVAIRMILPMNWALRRAGVVAWTQSVTW